MFFESIDKKYHTSINYVKFKDGEQPEEMWLVDAHTKKHYVMDEDFYSNYDDAIITFNEWVKEIKEDNKCTS